MIKRTQKSGGNNGKQSNLLFGIIIAIVLGTLTGGFFPGIGMKVAIIGDAFLNALMMLVVPLVIFSMIVGITGLGNIRQLGSLGRRTVLYYMFTTAISVTVGLILVNLIQPGKGISPGETHENLSYRVSGTDNRTVVFRGGALEKSGYSEKYKIVLLDQNVQGSIATITDSAITVKLWESRAAGDRFYIISEDGTRLPFRRIEDRLVSKEPEVQPSGNGIEIALPVSAALRGKQDGDIGGTLEEVLIGNAETGKQGMIPRNIFAAMANMEILPLIIFSLLFGAALTVLGKKASSAISIISALNDTVMQLIHWIMIVTPIGIFGLIAARIGQAGGFSGFWPELLALGKYSLTVMLGLAFHAFIVLPLLLRIAGQRNPLKYASGVGPALLNALSTASSSATLPLTLQGVEEENNVSNRTASFVLPLGATINMDGTALYEAVAAMFIAQVYGTLS